MGSAARDDLMRDVRHALRGMRRAPGFTIAAVALLALGIGASTSVHTVLRALLLAELPVDEPGKLVQLVHEDPSRSKIEVGHSYPAWEMFSEPRQTVREVFGFTDFLMQVLVSDRGAGELARAQGVTANYFSALRLQPAIGRLLDQPSEPSVVLSHAYWERRFGGDPRVLDRSLVIGATSFRVAGVTSPDFRGIERGKTPDLYFPIEYTMDLRGGGKLHFAGSWWMSVMARLQPGSTVEAAQAELESWSRASREMVVTSLPPQFAGSVRSHFDQLRFRVVPAATGSYSGLQQRSERPLWVLTAAAALLLLTGCANLAGLMVARGAAREKELGLRVALGCGKGRLLRQMITETLVLATLGGVIGLSLALWSGPYLLALVAGEDLLSSVDVRPDAAVLALFALTILLTAMLTGSLPALRAVAPHSRSGSTRPVQVLLALQIALSVVLLACAGLFARTLSNYRNVDPGFRRTGLISAQANPTVVKYDRNKLTQYGRSALEHLRALPGVESATLTESPLGSLSWTTMVEVAGHRAPAGRNPSGPHFARTLGLRLVSGRDLSDSDYGRNPVVVNRSFAREFLNGDNAVGRELRLLDGNKTFEIVGVVADARDRGMKRPSEPVIYTWWEHDLIGWMTFSVRGHVTGNEIRSALLAADTVVPVNQVETADELLNRDLARERMMAALGGFVGVTAALIAAVGLYAALAFSVSRRTREFGIRKALGARISHVIAAATRQSAVALACGLATGIPAAVLAGRALESQLFGVAPADPSLLLAAVSLIAFAAVIASLLPALRALRVSPAASLRNDG